MESRQTVAMNGRPGANGNVSSTFSATATSSTVTLTTSRPVVPDLLPTGADQQPEMSPTSKEFRDSSFATRRKSSQHLSPLRMKPAPPGVDAIDGVESRKEVEQEGVELFNIFMEGELARNGITETIMIERAVSSATIESEREEPVVTVPAFQFQPQSVASGGDASGTSGDMTPSLHRYTNPKWAKKGRDLRKLADQFAKSQERQKVRQKASETADDEEITAAMFWDLLSELFFQGRVTRERIVVLFFFCSDVAIMALQHNTVEYFHRFLVWALQFIRHKVCTWVANNGGWDAVLSASAGHLVTVGKVVMVGAVAYGLYKAVKYAHTIIVRR